MISLLSAGDTDILREATQSQAVFWYRARNSKWKLAALLGLTVLLVALLLILLFGRDLESAWLSPTYVAPAFSAVLVFWLVATGWVFYKFSPGRNDRVVMDLRRFVRASVDPLEERIRALSDEELRGKRAELQQRLADGATLEEIRPEAYACVREASRRAREHRQFECQLIGGRVIEDNSVAEMRTGEGKTIVCYMANYMKVLQGLKVHMVTVNDYLVKRDAEFCRPIFELLGVTVGYIASEMDSYGEGARVRQQHYACDITYGTNSEFGFDYLRDNMKTNPADLVQGAQDFAVVDEVDSVLIDEARTPLIISGPAHDDLGKYSQADTVARAMIARQREVNQQFAGRIEQVLAETPKQVQDEPKFRDGINKFKADPMWLTAEEAEAIGHTLYVVVELDRKSAHMTEHGAKFAQQQLGMGTFYETRNMNWPHYIDNALKAHLCYQRDKEYVVQEGKVVIVDEFTGRLMVGRQWSDGLHQAVEAKERVQIKQESQTLASITLQNLFKLYRQLAGMTGTAMTEAEEFMKIYKLEVISIPTNKPIRRIDYNDKLYKSISSKFNAIVEEIRSYSHNGYPEDPWTLFEMLREARKLLRNQARGDRDNAELGQSIELIDDALKQFNEGKGDPSAMQQTYLQLAGEHVGGRPVLVGTVSVESSKQLSDALTRTYGVEHEVLNAENHAREADIIHKAGQQHERTTGKKKKMVGNVTIATNMAGRGTDIVLGPGVADIGGLHVVGTERHESRRIDNQLRGRCGRQGDPGSSRFFLSFEDDLIKLFMGEWLLKMLNRFALEEGVPIEHRSLTSGIERAQKKVEERNFGIRKNLLEYDEVPDQQRKEFYELRRRVLVGEDLSGLIWDMLDETVRDEINRYLDPQYPANCAADWVASTVGVNVEAEKLDTSEIEVLKVDVRDQADAELRGNVSRTFGEYVDPTLEVEEWDLRGLVNWVEQYNLKISQNEVKQSDPHELEQRIIEAAIVQLEGTDWTGLASFVDPRFGRRRLAAWAHDKFGLELDVDELTNKAPEEVEQMLGERMRAAYREREIEYPVVAIIEYALRQAGSNRNVFYEQVARWANRKYALDLTYEHFAGKEPQQVFDELRGLNAEYLTNGKLDSEIDAAMDRHAGDELLAWARERFGRMAEQADLSPEQSDLRSRLHRCGYEMLRFELTQIERMVLLMTFDQAWKDHMYAMDLMRTGIGFRGYAERDPKIEFKREGTRLFNEMMSNIRARVTDLIFKVGAVDPGAAGEGPDAGVPAEPQPPSLAPQMTATHADATGAGFAQPPPPPQAQGQQGGGDITGQGGQMPETPPPPTTFKREQPKVGRNDPCPCGSGKKYKACHGKRKPG